MVMKLNNTGRPLFVGGRLVPNGTFYDAPEVEFVTTDNVAAENVYVPPDYDKITVPQMKTQLEAWQADFSEHEKDKQTLYAFYVEEAKKHADDARISGAGAGADPGQ